MHHQVKEKEKDSDKRKMDETLFRMLNTPPQPKTKDKQNRSENEKSAIIEKQ